MNDKKLRLKVLSRLYQNEKEGKPAPGTIKDIWGLSLEEYRWTSYYLITHNLAEGSMDKAGGHVLAWANHITGRGIDKIEHFIDKSIEQVEAKQISFKQKASSYLDKLLELGIIWSRNPDLQQEAWDLLTRLVE